MHCPLCAASPTREFARVRGIAYLRCPRCELTFVPPGGRPGPADELARYRTHENDPSDPRYRAFLERLAAPLSEVVPQGAEGLDYGAGPGPTLSVMLEERGYRVAIYDPWFAADTRVLRGSFDFITCSETAEHFHSPGAEFDGFDRMLRPGGWLGLMTGILRDDAEFPSWHYVRDPTHVCFYRPGTMRWIAGHYGWELRTPAENVALFRKPDGPSGSGGGPAWRGAHEAGPRASPGPDPRPAPDADLRDPG